MPVPTVRPRTDRPEREYDGMSTILAHLLQVRRTTAVKGSPGVPVTPAGRMGNNGRVTRPASTRAARLDQVCAAAVEVARAGITEVDADDVGDHLQVVAEGDRLVTHYFECRLAGYRAGAGRSRSPGCRAAVR
ncbi:hypothetical protein GCM10027614_43360 [Micromonospora vulcania]